MYEEAISKVMTVRDFTLVFDAYAQIEESLLASRMKSLEEGDEEVDEMEVDLRMARFEKLLDRRSFLVNDVLLRQNPHNIATWEKRIELFQNVGNNENTIAAFKDAMARINPRKVVGKLQLFWVIARQLINRSNMLNSMRRRQRTSMPLAPCLSSQWKSTLNELIISLKSGANGPRWRSG